MRRPAADDLWVAAEWVQAFSPGCEDSERLTKVAAWLRYQSDEAEKAAYVKNFMETGYSRAVALDMWRNRQHGRKAAGNVR
jgi:hypothetical protein